MYDPDIYTSIWKKKNTQIMGLLSIKTTSRLSQRLFFKKLLYSYKYLATYTGDNMYNTTASGCQTNRS